MLTIPLLFKYISRLLYHIISIIISYSLYSYYKEYIILYRTLAEAGTWELTTEFRRLGVKGAWLTSQRACGNRFAYDMMSGVELKETQDNFTVFPAVLSGARHSRSFSFAVLEIKGRRRV